MIRHDAIQLIAQEEMKRLSTADRRNIIEEWWGHAEDMRDVADDLYHEIIVEEGPQEPNDPRYDPIVLRGLRTRWLTVSNACCSERLQEFGYNCEIDEPSPQLLECYCCMYKTISVRGNYEICPVCFWEDDGENDPFRYSSANHMLLDAARRNFMQIGACSPDHVCNVDPDGKQKYQP